MGSFRDDQTVLVHADGRLCIPKRLILEAFGKLSPVRVVRGIRVDPFAPAADRAQRSAFVDVVVRWIEGDNAARRVLLVPTQVKDRSLWRRAKQPSGDLVYVPSRTGKILIPHIGPPRARYPVETKPGFILVSIPRRGQHHIASSQKKEVTVKKFTPSSYHRDLVKAYGHLFPEDFKSSVRSAEGRDGRPETQVCFAAKRLIDGEWKLLDKQGKPSSHKSPTHTVKTFRALIFFVYRIAGTSPPGETVLPPRHNPSPVSLQKTLKAKKGVVQVATSLAPKPSAPTKTPSDEGDPVREADKHDSRKDSQATDRLVAESTSNAGDKNPGTSSTGADTEAEAQTLVEKAGFLLDVVTWNIPLCIWNGDITTVNRANEILKERGRKIAVILLKDMLYLRPWDDTKKHADST